MVYKIQRNKDGEMFEEVKKIKIFDNPVFHKVCMNFHFQVKTGFERDSIIFAKKDQIFAFNFMTEEVTTIYKFKQELNK